MDVLEQMVNNHADAVRKTARVKRIMPHLSRALSAAIVALAFLLFDFFGLVNTALAVLVMMIASMVVCYSLGRCNLFGKAVR